MAASSSERMMVTTGTDGKRRQGKGEERDGSMVWPGGGTARTRREENEIEVREARNPCVAPSEAYSAEKWVARQSN